MEPLQINHGEFKEPWKDSNTALVLDLYGPNQLDFDELASEPRVAGIIHKASERLVKDPLYADRKPEAKQRGYKWGSYHLGRPGDPIAQADFYLEKANPTDDEVMGLDIEDTTDHSMSLANAERFVARIKEKTRRYPLLYITGKVRDALLESFGPRSEFAKTPLWYARYRRDNDITQFFPTKLWTTYTLWQFASEINCPSKDGLTCPLPRPIPGTEYDMDVNIFWGTVDDLRNKWPFTFREGE
jgi:lysozyme